MFCGDVAYYDITFAKKSDIDLKSSAYLGTFSLFCLHKTRSVENYRISFYLSCLVNISGNALQNYQKS